jgi:hypothetical protein
MSFAVGLTSAPGAGLSVQCWAIVLRVTMVCAHAIGSPMQPRFPVPKGR